MRNWYMNECIVINIGPTRNYGYLKTNKTCCILVKNIEFGI